MPGGGGGVSNIAGGCHGFLRDSVSRVCAERDVLDAFFCAVIYKMPVSDLILEDLS
jgi:hypothetical protein